MVSIIIPTYNDSEHLIKTISSCFVQDVTPEIIVVNDASTKPMPYQVIDLIAVLGGKYIAHYVNKGLAEARDTGISIASNQYILPLDCGDFLYPDVLGKMINAIDSVDVVHGNMTERDGGNVCVPPGKDGITRDGMLKMNQLWCTSMFRKSIWEKVGGYKNGLHTSYEDYHYFCKCMMAGAQFRYINELIYRHEYNPNSMLSTLHKRTDYFNELARKPLWSQL